MSNEEPEYVTFVSSDGFEFVVKRSAACVSDTVKRMLNSRSIPPPLLDREEGLIY
jgi:transcription elongation factor B subunit 1